MIFDKRVRLFMALAALFVVCLVLGDVIGGKLTSVEVLGVSFPISVGMVPFPVTFLLTDILNEFYGKRAARFVTWVGFAMVAFAIATLQLAMAIPWAGFTREPGWTGMTEAAFNNVFGGSQRILFASMVAYLTAQFIDIAVFHFFKRLTSNRFLWLRATGSTVVSQLVDTLVIQWIAWYGMMPLSRIGQIAVSSYAVKLVVAIGLTPLIYAGHALLERVAGIPPVHLDERGEALEPRADFAGPRTPESLSGQGGP